MVCDHVVGLYHSPYEDGCDYLMTLSDLMAHPWDLTSDERFKFCPNCGALIDYSSVPE